MQIQEKQEASIIIFEKEKFKLDALKEAKRVVKGTVF
jgi:hypothetical protein